LVNNVFRPLPIIRVKSTADVTADDESVHNVGSITGFNGSDIFNTDSPDYNPDDPEDPADYRQGGYIFQCRNEGNVTGHQNKIGGIAGENAGTIEQCVNTGTIKCIRVGPGSRKGWPGVGGITGRNGNNNEAVEVGHIINCYSTGLIIDDSETGVYHDTYADIAGWNDKDGTVEGCFATGLIQQTVPPITGTKNPIIGTVDEDVEGMSVNNYSLADIFKASTDVRLTGTTRTDAEMKAPAFVAELNGPNGGPYVAVTGNYPKLAWELE
jgi:hypothetical protein